MKGKGRRTQGKLCVVGAFIFVPGGSDYWGRISGEEFCRKELEDNFRTASQIAQKKGAKVKLTVANGKKVKRN